MKKNLILTQELWNKVKQRVRNLKVAATDGFWMTVFRDEPPDVEVKGRPLTYGVIACTSVPDYRPEFGNEDVKWEFGNEGKKPVRNLKVAATDGFW